MTLLKVPDGGVEMSLALLLRKNNNLIMCFANVTQLAERQPSKLEVVGSNPIIRFYL